jgi:DNA-directed RNA polymerase specialized sigma subunit
MPRGTNDPEAALLQRVDTDDVLDKIEERCEELRPLLDEFEQIMNAIEDRRLRIIIRDYYALGWSEERTGEHVGLSRQHVNRLRAAYIETLE